MFFPISGAHISPIYLATVGFLIGILGGFFGVGGSFIAGPALRLAGLDWNFAVGTDLAHIVGKSVVAVRRHRAMGNVDLRLGLIMAIGTIGGAELGAQAIQMLKRAGNVNSVVSIVSIVVYLSISTFMLWESRKTLLSPKARSQRGCKRSQIKKGPFGVRSCHARNSAPEDLAHDFSAGVGDKSDFAVDDSVSGIRWRGIQRLSRRRRRVHSDAVHGLRAGNSHSSRSGH